MGSTFGGLETGVRGLRAHQIALQTTGQNITNADTPGYSRQVAVLQTTSPYTYPSLHNSNGVGQIGSGVEVDRILRMRDDFIDLQLRNENALKGKWGVRQNTLEQLEVVINEPSDSSISARLNQFWNALNELATRSEDNSVRASVNENAIVFAQSLRHTNRQLVDLQGDLNEQLSVYTGKINTLAKQIAELNEVIGKVKASKQEPNDLIDQRERLIQELSGITNITISTDKHNRLNIAISGAILVAGDSYSTMKVVKNTAKNGQDEVVWTDNGLPVAFTNGEIKGLLETRDVDVQYFIDSLNEFTATLITRFNEVHQSGYGMDDSSHKVFFTGHDASDIDVNHLISMDLNLIAASDNTAATSEELPHGAPGNGQNARKLANVIKRDLLMNQNNVTLTEYYNGLIAKLGIDSEKAKATNLNQDTLINYLKDRQESVAGVSMDEEMSNLIKFQNAYNASTRYMTTIDEMLDKIVNGMGIVGR
jgi:flagellar hook-associated protein 1 FlgK